MQKKCNNAKMQKFKKCKKMLQPPKDIKTEKYNKPKNL